MEYAALGSRAAERPNFIPAKRGSVAALSGELGLETRRAKAAPGSGDRSAVYAFRTDGCGSQHQDAKGLVHGSFVRLLPSVALSRTDRQHGWFRDLETNAQTAARHPLQ